MPRRILALALLVSLQSWVFVPSALAADVNFYSLQDQWLKGQKNAKPSDRRGAVDEGYQSALRNWPVRQGDPGVPAAPLLQRAFAEAAASQAVLEIEYGQTLLLERAGGLVKFVSTDEEIVTLDSPDTETLRIVGSRIGSTFVHVWNAQGRSTLPVRVIPSKIVISRADIRERQAFEKNRPFRFYYDNSRSATYTGDKFTVMPRSSVDFNQNFRIVGDTPYGELSAHALTQKSRRKLVVTDVQAELRDGRIGTFQNFNAIAGDTQAKPNLMVFPSARIRGGQVEHWDDKKRTQWTVFHGRESSSLIGTLAPGSVSKRTQDSFLSGGVLDLKVGENAKIKSGYFQGYGRAREDELNRRGMGVRGDMEFGPHLALSHEADFDNEKFAHKHTFTTKYENLRIRNELRDTSKKFVTLTGPSSRQGEIGYLLDVTATPAERLALAGTFDIFRDRLVPNPEDPNRLNTHMDFSMNYFPCDEVDYMLTFQDLDDTGRLGPSRYRSTGLQYNERFDAWGHKMTLFTRFNNRTSHLLTNSQNDYRSNQLTLGLYTKLFWDINFSVQKEWNAVEEVERGLLTHPQAITYLLDKNWQLGQTPFFMETRLRIRDEEETESQSSFMAGEDSTELSTGLFYREYEDLEIFLTGSMTQYNPESLNTVGHRVEAQFYTGMRCSFDTALRWAAVGSFEGVVFKDVNGDGVRQSDEPGLANQLVVSSDGKKSLTDGEGRYEIKSVTGKRASLSLDSAKIPHGFVPTGPAGRDFEILQNKTVTVDFGLTPRSDVTGIVFNDLNGDGKYQTSEPGLLRVKLTLENGQNARTNAAGSYTISNVLAGEHSLTLNLESLPDGYLPAQAPKKSFTLYEGIRYEMHFPTAAKRTVTGRVFWDQNRNGSLDEKDMPLSGVVVKLGAESVTTDKDGWYLFDGLQPGVYELSAGAYKQKVEMTVEPMTIVNANIPLDRT